MEEKKPKPGSWKNSVANYNGNFKRMYKRNYGDIVDVGSKAKYTPETLFNQCVKYFEWAEENHLIAGETASFQGEVNQCEISRPRVFTTKGLSLFLMVSGTALVRWRKSPGYCDVMEFVDSVIHEQKYQLGVNGIINPMFIAKELEIDKPQNINVSAIAESESNASQTIEQAVESILNRL